MTHVDGAESRTAGTEPPRRPTGGERPLSSLWGADLRAGGRVRVLEVQPDLAEGLDDRAAALAAHAVVAPALWLEPGPWSPPVAPPERYAHWLGILVLDGLISRTVCFDHLSAQELVGPGDLLRPWDDDPAAASVPSTREWCVLERTRVALLDARFLALACHFPPVVTALMARTTQRARSLTLHLAISQARQAEIRLLLLFWHLADRWGHVSPAGTIVPVRLTHERIAELVCLRRPTVSVTLGRLAADGALLRRPDGSWLLPQPPPGADELARLRRSRATRAAERDAGTA